MNELSSKYSSGIISAKRLCDAGFGAVGCVAYFVWGFLSCLFVERFPADEITVGYQIAFVIISSIIFLTLGISGKVLRRKLYDVFEISNDS